MDEVSPVMPEITEEEPVPWPNPVQLAAKVRKLQEALKTVPLFACEQITTQDDYNAVAKAFGRPIGKNARVAELESYKQFYIDRPKRIPEFYLGHAVIDIRFQASCPKCRARESPGYVLVVNPGDRIFYWVDGCKECAHRAQEILVEDFEDYRESGDPYKKYNDDGEGPDTIE